MDYIGKWKFHSIMTYDENNIPVFLNAEEYLNSPMPYIDENDKEFKSIIANQLHKLANAIETGEKKLRGYICDYDSYPVYSLNGVIKIDWHKLNEEKKLKNNDKNTEK